MGRRLPRPSTRLQPSLPAPHWAGRLAAALTHAHRWMAPDAGRRCRGPLSLHPHAAVRRLWLAPKEPSMQSRDHEVPSSGMPFRHHIAWATVAAVVLAVGQARVSFGPNSTFQAVVPLAP